VTVGGESYNRKRGSPEPPSEDSNSEDDALGSDIVGQDTEPMAQYEESKVHASKN